MNPDTPCIEWTGRRGGRGYGRSRVDDRDSYAHRDAWEEAHGPIPEGMFVLHGCDNPPCRNAEHLFLGTHADNMRDRSIKNRGKGTRLDHVDVARILVYYGTGDFSQSQLAEHFGVSTPYVCQLVNNQARVA